MTFPDRTGPWGLSYLEKSGGRVMIQREIDCNTCLSMIPGIFLSTYLPFFSTNPKIIAFARVACFTAALLKKCVGKINQPIKKPLLLNELKIGRRNGRRKWKLMR